MKIYNITLNGIYKRQVVATDIGSALKQARELFGNKAQASFSHTI